MSRQFSHPRRLSLSLPPDAQWFVHHLVSLRLRRGGPTIESIPHDVPRTVFRKLEEGEDAFTPTELRYLRTELSQYLRIRESTPRNEVTARETLDRIDRVWHRQ